MCAYNAIDGVPCAANKRLLTDLMRGELGFDGFIVSDRGAIPSVEMAALGR
jgi:beta-glucosidase